MTAIDIALPVSLCAFNAFHWPIWAQLISYAHLQCPSCTNDPQSGGGQKSSYHLFIGIAIANVAPLCHCFPILSNTARHSVAL